MLASLVLVGCVAGCTEPESLPQDIETPFSGGVLDAQGPLSLSTEAFAPLLRQPLLEGLNLRHLKDDRGELVVVIAELSRFDASVVGIGERYPQGVTIEQLMAEPSTALLVGSGFVSELNALTPVGLLQIDDRVVSRIQRHGYTRVLGVDAQRFGVVDHLSFERGLFPSALQAGPGVVEQGEVDILPRDLERRPYYRALVGTCVDRTLFIASLTPIHLYSVGQMIVELAAREGLACDEVVNLAGDREALLAVRTAGGKVLYLGQPRTSKAAMVRLAVRDVDLLSGDELQ